MTENTPSLSFTIAAEHASLRLDQALAKQCPQFSRARLQEWIRAGRVLVDGAPCGQRDRTRPGQTIAIDAAPTPRKENWQGEDIPLRVLHEDEDIIVLDKPPGLVTHPGAGNPHATLANALLFHCPQLRHIPRAGIVQRLDKDTSGILVVAKSLPAHTRLARDLQAHRIKREYRALALGEMTGGGVVKQPIARHPTRRVRMAVAENGKPAVTRYRLLGRYPGVTELRVSLETGRTHQIRVHLSHIRHPLIGDPIYGGRNRPPKNCPPALRERLRDFPRQALHAESLTLRHPTQGDARHWQTPPPADYLDLLQAIRATAATTAAG